MKHVAVSAAHVFTIALCLPGSAAEQASLSLCAPLAPVGLEDEADFYLARWRRVAHAPLPTLRYFCGAVAEGYGRGGKKLGVPTANLPSSLFAEALADVPAGIYTAWCVLEPEDSSAGGADVGGGAAAAPLPAAVPAVVNVGFSPTFEGAENPEKIAEAHLLSHAGGDFYGRRLRMLLVAFQRPELKYSSLDDLVAAIRKDIADAGRALADDAALAALATHPLLVERPWPAAADASDWAAAPLPGLVTLAA